MAFAEEMLDNILHSQVFLQHLLFSDEAHFHLNGGVNTHNCCYWSDHNPHWTAEKPLHSPRTAVWAAIWYGGVIGPIFFDTNVNGDHYYAVLSVAGTANRLRRLRRLPFVPSFYEEKDLLEH